MAKEKDNSQVILADVLAQLKEERAPDIPATDYFEIFCAEQILKDYDLSYEEIEAGIVDGEHDGGIDSIYSFVNGELVHEDFDPAPFKKDVSIQLFIIQSKTSSSFNEEVVNRLISVSRNLLDLTKDPDSFDQYNEQVKSAIKLFRDNFRALASKFPKLEIDYIIAAQRPKGDVPGNIAKKADELKEVSNGLFDNAAVGVTFFGAPELLEMARRQPTTSFELPVANSLNAANGIVALASLSDFNSFLRDDDGLVRQTIFESNVRDSQGNTEVNKEIQKTLNDKESPDFWWLNNGITVLASKAQINGNVLTISDPQIVNGLQTSTQLGLFFDDSDSDDEDKRNVMLKVISLEDEETRDKIIKATNSQNAVAPATLRATDKVQRDIEANLKNAGLFYDRRKNFYKNEGKPAAKIVSIPLMAQSLMTVLLSRPNDARARPSSLIKDDGVYRQLFSEDLPVALYTLCGSAIKKIEARLREIDDLDASDRNNLRFYVLAYLMWKLAGKVDPSPRELAKLSSEDATAEKIDSSIQTTLEVYRSLGGSDQVAKGQTLKIELQKIAASEFDHDLLNYNGDQTETN